jgi:Ni/Co efflux regulator RcnB
MKSLLRNAIAASAAMTLLSSQIAIAQQSQPSGYGSASQHSYEYNDHSQHSSTQYNASQENHTAGHSDHVSYNKGWHKGDHYHGERYVVRDWHNDHLRQPPHGYEWVRSGDQFVLIAITSGIVASIIVSTVSH